MPVKSIVWSPLAERDFSDTLEYLDNKWGKSVVNQFLDITFKTIDWISANPKQFQIVYKRKGIR